MAAPLGFQFLPKREELLNFYLSKMLKNEELPPICSNVFTIADVYASHPCMIFDACNANVKSEEIVEESEGMEKRMRYFFTPLKSFIKKDGKNGKRIKRKAGSGSWKEEFSDDIKLPTNKDHVIGHEKYFTYKNGGGNEDECVQWRMHEYSLVGNQNMAISRITKVIRKKGGRNCPSSRIKIVLPLVTQQQQVQVMNNNNNNNYYVGFNEGQLFNNYIGDGQCFSKELTMQETNNNNVIDGVVSKESIISEVGVFASTSEEWNVEDVMELLDFNNEDQVDDDATPPSTSVEWTDEDVMQLFDFNNQDQLFIGDVGVVS